MLEPLDGRLGIVEIEARLGKIFGLANHAVFPSPKHFDNLGLKRLSLAGFDREMIAVDYVIRGNPSAPSARAKFLRRPDNAERRGLFTRRRLDLRLRLAVVNRSRDGRANPSASARLRGQ